MDHPDSAKRAGELAAYFTHCAILPTHMALSLRSAMTLCFKIKNFGVALTFARRLLETNPPAQIAQQVRLQYPLSLYSNSVILS